jgi:pimeloyl-ACP methyl ester carboxylesterase
MDLLGHGDNPTPWRGDLSFDRIANDVIATANHLGLHRLVLVGHSFGSGVAIACAAKTPRHVAGLLLADPIGDQRQAPEDEVSAFMQAVESDRCEEVIHGFWQRILAGAAAATRDRVMADLIATPQEVVVGGFRAMTEFDPISALGSYRGPRLAILTPDNDFPYSLHRLIPDLPHVRMTGTSHWLHMDQPDTFDALLAQFLVEIEGN